MFDDPYHMISSHDARLSTNFCSHTVVAVSWMSLYFHCWDFSLGGRSVSTFSTSTRQCQWTSTFSDWNIVEPPTREADGASDADDADNAAGTDDAADDTDNAENAGVHADDADEEDNAGVDADDADEEDDADNMGDADDAAVAADMTSAADDADIADNAAADADDTGEEDATDNAGDADDAADAEDMPSVDAAEDEQKVDG
jgi:hypothetical protein